jgi:glycosyltransferase involved in cell wall biosynthesis
MFEGDRMATKRILILSTALSGGGAEVIARLMVEQLRESECVLFENDANITVPKTEIRVALARRSGNLLGTLLVNVWRLVVIQWVKLKLRPMVTISHLEGPNIINLLTLFGGIKVIFVHNQVSQNYESDVWIDKTKLRLVRALYHRADKIVGVSEGVCKELVRSFNVEQGKILFIENPVDRSAVWEGSNKTYGDFRDQFLGEDYLINVASLTKQKNQAFLLRVFQQLVSENGEYDRLKLMLLGDGDQRSALYDLCSELGLTVFDPTKSASYRCSQVCLLGFEENPYPLIRRAKLLIMTSRWEGLPVALLESMTLGVPGVLADCSEGIRSVWRVPSNEQKPLKRGTCHWSSYGALINGMDDNGATFHTWTTAISHLLRDEALREKFSNAGRERAKDYDVSRVVEIWKRDLIPPC